MRERPVDPRPALSLAGRRGRRRLDDLATERVVLHVGILAAPGLRMGRMLRGASALHLVAYIG
jgi:hypothetical protein